MPIKHEELKLIANKILLQKSRVVLIIKTEAFDEYGFLLESIENTECVFVVGLERNDAEETVVFQFEDHLFSYTANFKFGRICFYKQNIPE